MANEINYSGWKSTEDGDYCPACFEMWLTKLKTEASKISDVIPVEKSLALRNENFAQCSGCFQFFFANDHVATFVSQLLKLADNLDSKGHFDEANVIDEIITQNRIRKKKIDPVIPLGYKPQNAYETVQQLQNL